MLDKTNKNIYSKLNDDYQLFANKFIKELNSKCKKDTHYKEAINQTFEMLYNGNKNNIPLIDIISDQNKYINEILKSLTPIGKSELKLIISLSLIINIIVISLVIYFTTYSPINLEKPNIHVEENNNLIVWNEVENNSHYEIYVNDKLIKTSQMPFFNYSKVNLYDFEVGIKAVGKGRYKSSFSKMDVKVLKEYVVLNELSNHDNSSIPYENGETFEGFKSFLIGFDIYNKAYIKYKPIYNGYYEISMTSGNIISISLDGELLNIVDKVWLYSGKEYVFELYNNSVYISHLNLKLFKFNPDTLDSIPAGKTIFKSNNINSIDLKSANITNPKIRFANISTLQDEPVFFNQYIDINSGYVVVENLESSSQALDLIYTKSDIDQNSGSITIHPGYNNILFPTSMFDPLLSVKLALYYKDELTLYKDGMVITCIENDDMDKFNYILFDANYYHVKPSQILVMLNKSNKDIVIEYDLIFGIKEMDSSNFDLPFGYYWINYEGETTEYTFSKPLIIDNKETSRFTFEKGKYYSIFNPWKSLLYN